jgi:hypothetical protein
VAVEASPPRISVEGLTQPAGGIRLVRYRHAFGLAAVLALAVFLNFFRLQQEGFGNLYYAAANRRMLQSSHNS